MGWAATWEVGALLGLCGPVRFAHQRAQTLHQRGIETLPISHSKGGEQCQRCKQNEGDPSEVQAGGAGSKADLPSQRWWLGPPACIGCGSNTRIKTGDKTPSLITLLPCTGRYSYGLRTLSLSHFKRLLPWLSEETVFGGEPSAYTWLVNYGWQSGKDGHNSKEKGAKLLHQL